MKIGLVGFGGSGKTTVFNTMTGQNAPVGFGGDVRLGMVKVPDERIDELSRIFSPKKTTYAEMTFCDIPGEYGAENRGLSSKALQQIRDQEALCLVLRDFANPAVEGDPNPIADLDAFNVECGEGLCLGDSKITLIQVYRNGSLDNVIEIILCNATDRELCILAR